MEIASVLLWPVRVPARVVRALDDLATLAERARRDPDPAEQIRDRIDLLIAELAALNRAPPDLLIVGRDAVLAAQALLRTTQALDITGRKIISGGQDLTAVSKALEVDRASSSTAVATSPRSAGASPRTWTSSVPRSRACSRDWTSSRSSKKPSRRSPTPSSRCRAPPSASVASPADCRGAPADARGTSSQRRGIDRPLAAGAAGVDHAGALDQHHVALGRRHGQVLDPARHDEQLALLEPDVVTVAEAQLQAPANDEEELVGIGVVMPDEIALELGELDLEVVDGGGDAWAPRLRERSERVGEVHLVGHGLIVRRHDPERPM
jgi:hypothetical protein